MLSLFCAFWLLQCAGQVPPPGGEVDRVPPRILRTEPDSNAVHVETDRVVLEFSEYVDRRSVEQAIFISPWPGEVSYDWSGTEVAVIFPGPLKKDRTYVVSVGTDVIDRRERNRMGEGFSLAFSTGDSIDQGFIAGRVFDDKPAGIMLFAYALDGTNPDTLNPGTLRPDYVTQTGNDGAFTLANLAVGSYRVIAVRDEFHDLLYGKQIDEFGVPTGDVLLAPERLRVDGLRIRLAREDTSHPFLTGLQFITTTALQARFSESIDSLSVGTAALALADTLSGHTVGISDAYLLRESPSTLILPLAVPLDSGTAYRFTIRGLTDRAGNLLDSSTASAVIVAGGMPDTIAPGWTILGVRDSLRGYPPGRPLVLIFSEPVDRTAAANGITLTDSGRTVRDIDPQWLDPASLALNFRTPLTSRTWYHLHVVLDSLRDLHGNARKDSTRVIRFQTFDMKMTGMIDGWVRDSSRSRGVCVVMARGSDGPDPEERTVRLPAPGAFSLRELPEGFYALWAYRDADSSGAYSFGLPFPFRPSENFTVLPETLKVRARWGVEGAALILR
jgi:hypothetical protein